MAETETGPALGSNSFDGLSFGPATGENSAINPGGGVGGIDQIDPGKLGDSGNGSGSGEPARKRGRPKGWRKDGSGTAAPSKNNQITVDGVESLLLTLHSLAAMALSQPAINLDPKEAAILAKSIRQVQDQFPVTRIDPKLAAIIQLGGVAGMVYGPRVVAIKIARARRIPAPAPAPEPAPVVPAGPPTHVDSVPMVEKIDPNTGIKFMVPAPGPITQ